MYRRLREKKEEKARREAWLKLRESRDITEK